MKKIDSLFRKHGGTILAIASSFGVVSTAVLSGMATYKTTKTIIKKDAKSKKEKLKIAVPIYIPTVLSGISTIACIVSNNIYNKWQKMSMASVYALLSNSYRNYRDKLKELHGEDADLEIISNIASEKFPDEEIPEGLELFFDRFSKRYFKSTMEDVIMAVYNLNRQFAFRGRVSINEFYDFLEIPRIDGGDEVGWSVDFMAEDDLIPWIDVNTLQAITCDDKQYYVIDFDLNPIEGFDE